MRPRAFVRAIGVSIFIFATTALGTDAFRIRRVTPGRVTGGSDPWVQLSGSSNSIDRFQQAAAQVPGQEDAQEFTVVWRYTGRRRVDRVDVVFAFRQENAAEERSIRLSHRAVGPGSAESVFRVPADALRRDGGIEAWKASIVVDGEVVDSRSSWSWNR